MNTTYNTETPLLSPPETVQAAASQLAIPKLLPATIIGPAEGWRFPDWSELWRYRELMFFLAWRDVAVRYKQTVLGIAWAVLQPAMMMAVFTIFFGRMGGMAAGEDVPYPLFVLSGLLPWTFFATAITSAGNSVVGSERLITKIYFPRLAIPFASVGVALSDFLIACGLLVVVMVVYGVTPSWSLLLAPVIFAIIFAAALGLGTLLAALNVRYRDFRYVLPFLVQLALFATPTVYTRPATEGSLALQTLLLLNPMTSLIAAFRSCVLGGPVEWGGVGIAAVMALGMLLGGCLYFRKVEDGFADVI